MLTTVEKVIFLQDVDVFKNVITEDLAHIAAICDEISVHENTAIYTEGQRADAMYLVLDGKIRLHKDDQDVMIASKRDAFGTWALFEDELRVVTATSLEESHLLRIDKDDFVDLLADNVRITQSIMEALVHRVRGLMNRISHSPIGSH